MAGRREAGDRGDRRADESSRGDGDAAVVGKVAPLEASLAERGDPEQLDSSMDPVTSGPEPAAVIGGGTAEPGADGPLAPGPAEGLGEILRVAGQGEAGNDEGLGIMPGDNVSLGGDEIHPVRSDLGGDEPFGLRADLVGDEVAWQTAELGGDEIHPLHNDLKIGVDRLGLEQDQVNLGGDEIYLQDQEGMDGIDGAIE
jgi:hypothetical protein